MPRLTPTSDSETPALLALRRTLWQLAFLGILTAAVMARIAPQSGVIALWCALVPLSALAAHFRSTLLDTLPLHRRAGIGRATLRRTQRQRPQARRARGDGVGLSQRRQLRPRQPRDPAQAGPLSR